MTAPWWQIEGARFAVRLPSGVEAVVTHYGAIVNEQPGAHSWGPDEPLAVRGAAQEQALVANVQRLGDQPVLAQGETTLGSLALWLCGHEADDMATLCSAVGDVELAPGIYWDRSTLRALLAPILRRQFGFDAAVRVAVKLRVLGTSGLTASFSLGKLHVFTMPKPIADTAYEEEIRTFARTTEQHRLRLRAYKVHDAARLASAMRATRFFARTLGAR